MTETLSPALPDTVETLAARVLRRACERDWKIATAESCTGGMLASLLTDVEGCAHAFERGYVVYSEAAKCELLSIAPERIERCGVVSREVAEAMADGALAASKADVAIGITGFAGAGAPGDEAGLVHFACATQAGIRHREEHFGDIGRGATRIACMDVALTMIDEALA